MAQDKHSSGHDSLRPVGLPAKPVTPARPEAMQDILPADPSASTTMGAQATSRGSSANRSVMWIAVAIAAIAVTALGALLFASSSETVANQTPVAASPTSTPEPTATADPVPTSAPVPTEAPQPDVPPTPAPESGGRRPDPLPSPTRAVESDDPWVDTPQFDVSGIGTRRLGTFGFGGPVDNVVDVLDVYAGPGRPDDGGGLYWGPSVDRAAVHLTLDPAGNLLRFDVSLVEVEAQGLGPVFVGLNGWLMSGPFRFDQDGPGRRTIYIGDDDDGLAVRCDRRNVCLHQEKELNERGEIERFGRVLSYHADLTTAHDTAIWSHIIQEGELLSDIHDAPSIDSDVLTTVDLTNGVSAAVMGEVVEDGRDGWVHVTLGRDRLQRSGWLRVSENYTFIRGPSDAQGPLPRLEPPRADIAALIGRSHGDPFAFMDQDVFGLGYEWGDVAVGTNIQRVCCNEDPPYFVETSFSTDGFSTVDVVLSEGGLETGDWKVVDAWTFRLGADQLLSDGGDGHCDFVPGDGRSMLIINTDYEPIRGWVLEDNQYVEADISNVKCSEDVDW